MIESLGKLGVRAGKALLAIAPQVATSDPASAPFVEWVRLNPAGKREFAPLVERLRSDDSLMRLRAAYVVRCFAPSDWPDDYVDLARLAEREPKDVSSRAFMFAAAWVLATEERAATLHAALLETAGHGETFDRLQTVAAMAQHGTSADLPRLVRWLGDEYADWSRPHR